MDHVEISVTTPWAWEARNQNNWYTYHDFNKDSDFMNMFSAEDRHIFQNVYLLPLFFHSDLQGIALLFHLKEPLSREDLQYLRVIFHNFSLAHLSEKLFLESKSNQLSYVHDPLSGLKKLIDEKIEAAKKQNIKISIIVSKISNAGRLNKTMGAEEFSLTKSRIKAILSAELSTESFLAEIFPSTFFMILFGQNNASARQFIRLSEKLIRETFPDQNTRPILSSKIETSPIAKSFVLASFLFE